MPNYEFKRYEKVHRFDHLDEVQGILNGECHIFEKLDGANASTWANHEERRIYAASRNQIADFWNFDATEVSDSFNGLSTYIFNSDIIMFLLAFPQYRLYGEWLIKHTIVYPAEYLDKFYVFDVEDMRTGQFLSYKEYRSLLFDYEIPFIAPLSILQSPSIEDIRDGLGRTNYGAIPQGEGLVVKNYGFVNQYGRQTYAKMVSKEFKEMNAKVFGGPIPKEAIEMKIASVYCPLERVVKILGKIKDAKNGEEPNIKDMGRLLGMVYNDIITEEMWTILKKFKNPTIDFRKLQNEITSLAKNHFLGILQGACHEAYSQTDL